MADEELKHVDNEEEFYTQEAADEGVPMHLFTRTGEKTDKFITVRGKDSNAWRFAETERERELVRLKDIKDEKKRAEAAIAADHKALLVLVAGWNLPTPFAPENVLALFKKAPQIADQINFFAGSRALFFAEKLRLSSSTPDTKQS